jgi:hypothetical protein
MFRIYKNTLYLFSSGKYPNIACEFQIGFVAKHSIHLKPTTMNQVDINVQESFRFRMKKGEITEQLGEQ